MTHALKLETKSDNTDPILEVKTALDALSEEVKPRPPTTTSLSSGSQNLKPSSHGRQSTAAPAIRKSRQNGKHLPTS